MPFGKFDHLHKVIPWMYSDVFRIISLQVVQWISWFRRSDLDQYSFQNNSWGKHFDSFCGFWSWRTVY